MKRKFKTGDLVWIYDIGIKAKAYGIVLGYAESPWATTSGPKYRVKVCWLDDHINTFTTESQLELSHVEAKDNI